jgi:hypothetical protein
MLAFDLRLERVFMSKTNLISEKCNTGGSNVSLTVLVAVDRVLQDGHSYLEKNEANR